MWKLVAVMFCIITYNQCVKFGEDNSYTCHCNNDEQCNEVNGKCDGGCAKGWSGVSCQKHNVALDKPTSQVHFKVGRESGLAVDGDNTTNIPNKCIDTDKDGTIRWWKVDLLEEYPIKHITIYYQSYPNWALGSLNGFSLHINKENEEPELCYKDITKNTRAENNIECSQVIIGRYVNISNFHTSPNARWLSLCEVEIFVCSLGTFGSDCTNFCHCLNNERCSETGQCPGSNCSDGWTGTTCSQKCTKGLYGDGCKKKCSNRKCLNNSPCDHVRGECIGGCSDGYILTDCSKVCDNDMYGTGCLKLCSERNCLVETSSCNHIIGSCQGGCKEGFTGIDCIRCKDGVYGAGCSKKCSDRKCLVETSPCNHINGSCQGGCKEGFTGIDCVKTCKDGVYGAGCSKKCSDRKCKDSNLQCDSKTGECIDGCQRGYQSIDCIQESFSNLFSQLNCSAIFLKTEGNIIEELTECFNRHKEIDCRKCGSESKDQSSTIIGTILGIIFGFVAGSLVVLFIMKRRSKANQAHTLTREKSSNNVPKPESTTIQPVTQPSSNISNNQDNPYDQLTTAYQNENAYDLLEKT